MLRVPCPCGLLAILAGLLWVGCSPSPQELIEDLADAADRDVVRQELLLGGHRSVAPLLEALDAPGDEALRPEIVSLLTDLLARTDDARLQDSLDRLLRHDGDPRVRALVARRFGQLRRTGSVDALIQALEDPDDEVRYEALVALDVVGRLEPAARAQLREAAPLLLRSSHTGLRDEALIWVERAADEWVTAARQAELEGRMAQADSLLHRARAYAPTSRRVAYRQGRFYLDAGRQAEGHQVLRDHGMLLDVPLLDDGPVVDGRLDEAFWRSAARSDSFFTFSDRHVAALTPSQPTHLFVGRTAQALYLGAIAFDPHPEDLVAGDHGDDTMCGIESWYSDFVNFVLYPQPDTPSWGHIGVGASGKWSDSWHGDRLRSRQDAAWQAVGDFAVHVGDDRWSLEYRLDFGQPRLPAPRPGEAWGFNANRSYRGREVSRWVRIEGRTHRTTDSGRLLFQ